MKRIRVLSRSLWMMFIVFCVFLFCCPQAAWSAYPERPIRIVIGYDPGGPADLLTRAAAVGVEKALGTQLILENNGGAGGALALAHAANAKPDGYTLSVANNVSVVDQALLQKAPFKPLQSFTGICALNIGEDTALCVLPGSPLKNFNDFINYAKANPGKFKYSTPGVGSAVHVALEVVAAKDGLQLVHVPHKGSAPAMTALLGGHVDAVSAGSQWRSSAKGGQVRPLVSYARQRVPGYPDLPTLKELGYDFVHELIAIVVGPAGLPADVVKKLEEAFKSAVETPEYKDVLVKVERGAYYLTGVQVDQHLRERWAKTEKEFKEAGIIKEAATAPR